jgi:hypothetical protein
VVFGGGGGRGQLASFLLSTKARARSKVSCARMLAYRKLLRSGSAAASHSASRLQAGRVVWWCGWRGRVGAGGGGLHKGRGVDGQWGRAAARNDPIKEQQTGLMFARVMLALIAALQAAIIQNPAATA